MAAFIADRIVRCHLLTMARMNVAYDLLAWEGDILRLHFWARAFEILKEKGAVFLQDQGRLAGCWVMRIEDEGGDAGQASRRAGGLAGGRGRRRRAADDENREKVIVRSNGTVTYVGKDMAYQFWKFGVLGRGLPLPDLRARRVRPRGLGHVGRRHRTRRQPPARSAARAPCSTSSTCASRTCRNC